jgi:hypothetical protein
MKAIQDTTLEEDDANPESDGQQESLLVGGLSGASECLRHFSDLQTRSL